MLRADGTHEILPCTGPPLGVLDNIDIQNSDEYSLASGDALFIPTDGIEETHLNKSDLFGKERMLKEATVRAQDSAESMIRAVFNAARAFAEGTPQQDDMTAVAVRVR